MPSTAVHDEMLDINEPHLYHESISSMNFHEYTPQTQANNNTAGQQISMIINNQDIYTLPSKYYISFKGQIRRADNNDAYVAANEITLINNAIMYHFTGIKCELGNTTIEFINYPGQTTSMLGYLSYLYDFSTSATSTVAVVKILAKHLQQDSLRLKILFRRKMRLSFSSDPLRCFEFHIP